MVSCNDAADTKRSMLSETLGLECSTDGTWSARLCNKKSFTSFAMLRPLVAMSKPCLTWSWAFLQLSAIVQVLAELVDHCHSPGWKSTHSTWVVEKGGSCAADRAMVTTCTASHQAVHLQEPVVQQEVRNGWYGLAPKLSWLLSFQIKSFHDTQSLM